VKEFMNEKQARQTIQVNEIEVNEKIKKHLD
jgi:hypothetical protein